MTRINESERPQYVLRESEQRLALCQALAHVGDWEWELAGNALYWSDELYRIYGFEPHEIAPDYDLVLQKMHPENKEEFQQAIDLALKGEKPFEMDYTISRKDGSEAILHAIGQLVHDQSGVPVRMVGVVLDVSEQKQAEMLLRASENRCRTIFDKANDGILIADAEEKKFLEANRRICEMLGYSMEEILKLGVADIHPAEALVAVQDVFERQMRGEIALAECIPVKRKDGTIFFADINSTSVNMAGKACMVGLFRDITERKRAEEELKAEKKRLAESQRIAHIGSWEHNLSTNEAFWSDELFLILGLKPEKGGEDFDLFFNMVHPDDRSLLKKSIENTRQFHQPFSIEYRFSRADGTMRIIHAQAELIPDSSGQLVVLSGTAQDITERKSAEEKIQKSEEYIRNILDTVDEGFILVDRNYRILTANRAYCEQVGGSLEEVLGRHCFDVSHKCTSPCYEKGEECSVNKVFASGVPSTAHHRHEDAEGNTTYVETKAFPLRDASGNVIQAIETVNDITEKLLLEEERLKVQKLEAIGTLAGGIAHDFNNLLQGVFGYLSLAKSASGPNERSRAALEEAEKALHLTVKLTNQLLTFSKGGKPLKKPTDLRTVIDNAVRFSLSGSSVKCHIFDIEDLWQVEVDEGQITQVIQNIVLNATQAMPGGGRVDVRMRNCQFSEFGESEISKTGPYVEIAIQDEGIGIQEKDLKRIFDPYFSTKERGSGLGLATWQTIGSSSMTRILPGLAVSHSLRMA
ncbi:MAG: PAS domain S-box protein [Deltaproteobacteria bacterium]